MFKLIVAGCRNIENYEFVKERIHDYLDLHPEVNVTEIVSGTARGVDTCGEKYAAENNLKVTKFRLTGRNIIKQPVL